MGCVVCRKKPKSTVVRHIVDQYGYRTLFYATNEFDLSRSESQFEEENFSLYAMKTNKQQMTKKEVISPSNELNSIYSLIK